MTTASSRHTGGVNVMMCDGSARFVANDVSRPTWQALGSRNGEEMIQRSSFDVQLQPWERWVFRSGWGREHVERQSQNPMFQWLLAALLLQSSDAVAAEYRDRRGAHGA